MEMWRAIDLEKGVRLFYGDRFRRVEKFEFVDDAVDEWLFVHLESSPGANDIAVLPCDALVLVIPDL